MSHIVGDIIVDGNSTGNITVDVTQQYYRRCRTSLVTLSSMETALAILPSMSHSDITVDVAQQ